MSIRRISFQSVPVDVQDRALACDNVDDLCAQLAVTDVNITNQPQDAPWAPGVRWATIRDTEDNVILLESLKN